MIWFGHEVRRCQVVRWSATASFTCASWDFPSQCNSCRQSKRESGRLFWRAIAWSVSRPGIHKTKSNKQRPPLSHRCSVPPSTSGHYSRACLQVSPLHVTSSPSASVYLPLGRWNLPTRRGHWLSLRHSAFPDHPDRFIPSHKLVDVYRSSRSSQAPCCSLLLW